MILQYLTTLHSVNLSNQNFKRSNKQDKITYYYCNKPEVFWLSGKSSDSQDENEKDCKFIDKSINNDIHNLINKNMDSSIYNHTIKLIKNSIFSKKKNIHNILGVAVLNINPWIVNIEDVVCRTELTSLTNIIIIWFCNISN